MAQRRPGEPVEERTYTNPVYPHYFADPFVWQHEGIYYAVGTGPAEPREDGEEAETRRVFPLLRSSDFVTWRAAGAALQRPDPSLGGDFWAPEVAFHEGTFYLYYSVGHGDKEHQLRVATSQAPEGPYIDTGTPLTDLGRCPFAIDAHAFRDDDGQWYLFYARDFLELEAEWRVGTGIAVDRLIGMTRLAGEERIVLRARSEWQRFLKDRPMYGAVYDWHTVEGPCVRKVNGRYYCLFSGGRWETAEYGVDYGVADHVLGPYTDAGNESGPRVLRTIPGQVLGPGHNSIARGPDGETDYIIYHAWGADLDARRMCLDRLDWTPDGPRSLGPTRTPQRIQAAAGDRLRGQSQP
jgi:beta-xylosidase